MPKHTPKRVRKFSSKHLDSAIDKHREKRKIKLQRMERKRKRGNFDETKEDKETNKGKGKGKDKDGPNDAQMLSKISEIESKLNKIKQEKKNKNKKNDPTDNENDAIIESEDDEKDEEGNSKIDIDDEEIDKFLNESDEEEDGHEYEMNDIEDDEDSDDGEDVEFDNEEVPEDDIPSDDNGADEDSEYEDEEETPQNNKNKTKTKIQNKSKSSFSSSSPSDSNMSDEDLSSSIASHEASIQRLKQSDPEFYSHLAKEDPSLLEFSQKLLETEIKQSTGEDDEQKPLFNMDLSTWSALVKSVRAGSSFRSLQKVIKLFHKAAHANDQNNNKGNDGEDGDEKGKGRQQKGKPFLSPTDQKFYEDVIRLCVKEFPFILHTFYLNPQQIKSKSSSSSSSPIFPTHPHWRRMFPILKSYFSSYIHLLNNTLETKMKRFLLTYLNELVPYIQYIPNIPYKLMKILLDVWSKDDKNSRIDSFFILRKMSLEIPTLLPTLLKSSYLLYLKVSKFSSSIPSHPIMEFLLNCIIEFYTIDMVTSYEYCFVYIRQLAIIVRKSLDTKSSAISLVSKKGKGREKGQGAKGGDNQSKSKKDKMFQAKQNHRESHDDDPSAFRSKNSHKDEGSQSYKSVYNWQFLWSLRLWGRLLAVAGKLDNDAAGDNNNSNNSPSISLSALIYPYTQLCLSTLSILPATRYYPLKLHVLRILFHLSSSLNLYIPLSLPILSLFSSHELSRKPLPPSQANTKMPSPLYVLKVSPMTIKSKEFQSNLIDHSLQILMEYLTHYSYSIAFPELAFFIEKTLKKFTKTSKIHSIVKKIKRILNFIQLNNKFINEKRKSWAMSVTEMRKKGIHSINTFKPKGQEEEEGKGQGKAQGKSKAKGGKEDDISPLEKFQRGGEMSLEENKTDGEKSNSNWNIRDEMEHKEKGGKKKKKDEGEEDEDEDDEEGDEDEEKEGGDEDGDDDNMDDDQDDDDDSSDDNDDDGEGQGRKVQFDSRQTHEDEDEYDDDEDARPSKKQKSKESAKVKVHSNESEKKNPNQSKANKTEVMSDDFDDENMDDLDGDDEIGDLVLSDESEDE